APEQADRYQTVAEMAEDIDALIRGKMDFRTTRFDTGEFLIREGDVGKEFYIVVQGSVEVFKEHDGNKIQLGTIGKDGIVGEMAMITHETRSASVVALEPTEVMVLTDEVFAQNLKKMPPWMERTFVVLAERLQEADNRLAGK
ncbi:MAG: cyclic nucleotide-binding domain-containing protein, partial [Planctomycetes bacterium]|nr:cyclic nucleotide-binding domain-containing protein [Planctomycetota bacterium]